MFRRLIVASALAIACAWLAVHLVAIGREAVNWDEFAIHWRTAELLRTGRLLGGGRPGLVEVVLVPFVRGCTDGVAAVREARWAWSLVTCGAAAAFIGLLRRFRTDRAWPAGGAIVGAGLWALVPAVMRWSVQVRTDQCALVLGLAGGLALLESRNRRWLALVGGFGLGLGFLCTQKLLYVALLVLILVIADALARAGADRRSEVLPLTVRALVAALGAGMILAAYRFGLTAWLELPRAELLPLKGGLKSFDHYRSVFGFVTYRAMIPTLAAHLALLGLLVARSLAGVARSERNSNLLVAWTLLLAGVGVGAFHAGAFPYFWMTLGLFPAAAFAVCWEDLFDILPASTRSFAMVAVGALLLVPAAFFAPRMLLDSQRPQREAFDFIGRNFAPRDAGYQIEGALYCRPDPEPFPVLFRDQLERYFSGEAASSNSAAFIDRFREKQVRFLVYSHMTPFFPQSIREFWTEHYVAYRGVLWLPGRAVSAGSGQSGTLDVIVPGRYRWLSGEAAGAALAIDGHALASGETMDLAAGSHRYELLGGARRGLIVLAVSDPPASAGGPFYSAAQIREITGRGYF